MRSKISAPKEFDWSILLVVAILVFLGIVFVYDASAVRGGNLFGGKYYFLILQSLWAGLGFAVLIVAASVKPDAFYRVSHKLLLVSVAFLVLTAVVRLLPEFLQEFLGIFVPKINGSYRWIYLNPSPLPSLPLVGRLSFQPSELAKISLVLYWAANLTGKKRIWSSLRAIGVMVVLAGLVLWQPDFGTALIITLTGLTLYLLSGVPWRRVIFLSLPLLFIGILFAFGSPYRRERIKTYLSPDTAGSLSSAYQVNQILIALGSGGFFGLGLGQSRQKYDYVPEVNTDSIFAILGEELGFLGVSFVLLLFAVFVYRGFLIARRAGDQRSCLLASGITFFIGLQALINLAGLVRLLPLTGVPLPLLSYGGSSLVVNMFSLGILLGVSRQGSKR